VTIPGAGDDAPTANYDIVVTDSDSVNVLGNTDDDLLNRHTSNTEEVYFRVKNVLATPEGISMSPVVCSKLTVTVAAAGDTNSGTLVLYYEL